MKFLHFFFILMFGFDMFCVGIGFSEKNIGIIVIFSLMSFVPGTIIFLGPNFKKRVQTS